MEKFRKKSLLGCENDYDIFKDQLEPLIERTHNGRKRHCGKVPSAMPEDRKKQIEILNLKQQLQNAVKSEDYETAAKLRDRIEQL
jgi:protein arginine kinase activator